MEVSAASADRKNNKMAYHLQCLTTEQLFKLRVAFPNGDTAGADELEDGVRDLIREAVTTCSPDHEALALLRTAETSRYKSVSIAQKELKTARCAAKDTCPGERQAMVDKKVADIECVRPSRDACRDSW